MENSKVSIIIPTINAGIRFKKVLDGIFSQNFKDYEVLIIDLGSTDETLQIASTYPVNIVKMPASSLGNEPGHGRTRNYAATLVKGEFIVFISHDVIPENSMWLEELLTPFTDINVCAAYGRQLPRTDEKILDKNFFEILYGDKKIEWTKGTYSQGDNIFSDACSAIRTKILLDNPYKSDIIVSEDYEWANRIMQKGYKIIYQPSAKVIHSHSYNLITLFKRNFDIGVSYKSIEGFNNNKNFINKGFKLFLTEVTYVLKVKKVHLIPMVLIRDLIRFIAINLGKKEELFPRNIKRTYLSAQRWYWE